MTEEILNKANALNRKIDDFQNALNCFEWRPTLSSEPISNNPELIIEFDDNEGGREQIKLPMSLSNAFIDFMKQEIKNGLAKSEAEFAEL